MYQHFLALFYIQKDLPAHLEQKVSLWACAGLSPLLPSSALVLGKMNWRSPFWVIGLLMCIWRWFLCIQFWVKRGNLWPLSWSWGLVSPPIILGSPKILKLASIDHPYRAIANNWLNAVHIWPWTLANHHKLLIFILVLDFVATLQVVM